mmetsp:Transcript_3782/g.9915  ORF Transcript_3782/g.9915 Transcript_3782/m.9915 type:complete len:493 (-) Transcript_3782:314-1792(-)|eukprot:CAMPEP_0197183552 /NCGR_PEP_ID=MMETSP1423-20130617/7878_1 /TAXON_ID=476441 /ORGANISM="Pseudo-nitzschia heimii, Strain UNC1101" /LENGTH=492 /DNA_ID=CAMNT_0042634137 /DNA_START=47 /DNA_END=1525 /DNA_ORIENTATION=-
MKLSIHELILLVGFVLPSKASFIRDVVRNKKPSFSKQRLNQNLMEKAVPLDEYIEKNDVHDTYLRSGGSRHLEDANDDEEDEYENNDDYYLNEYNYVNYTGYSFKYAKCQPVQRFSQNAVEAGEYSPMVVNDIVILRLCNSVYCSDNRAYGCNTDYVEYAIELTDYIRIMLRYEMDKKEQLCDWCDTCGGNRRRVADRYYYTYDEYGNIVETDDYVSIDCTGYDSYCFDGNGNTVCEDEDDGDDDSYSMTLEGYLNIIDCTQVNGGYFLRPRCDAYSETLTMGVYHDKFCAHYAGNEISINNFNLGINQSYFQEFGKAAGCKDCSESDLPPYFNANSNLCNRLDTDSARCTSSTTSELFVNNYTDSSSTTEQCSFMESVRFGTYDADGQLYIDSTFTGRNRKVTNSQKWLLVVSMAICGILAVYSCYLHHAITNLLIKSLSHTDLLPPSKFRRRAASSGGNRRRAGKRATKSTNEDSDRDGNDNTKRNGVEI